MAGWPPFFVHVVGAVFDGECVMSDVALNRKRLCFLLAGERFFGATRWSWESMGQKGLSLCKEEALWALENSGECSELAGLYLFLFERKPFLFVGDSRLFAAVVPGSLPLRGFGG